MGREKGESLSPPLSSLPSTGGHFACACVHPLNDNSVGASNLIAGNRKLASRYGPFKSHFVGALNTILSYKKHSP